MVKGNTTAKKLARELKSSNPQLNYTQALTEVQSTVDSVVTEELFATLSPDVQNLMPLGGTINDAGKCAIQWEKLRRSLGEGWECKIEGHFNDFHISKKVEGHVFGLLISDAGYAEDTLNLSYKVGSESVVVGFPLNEEEEDLFGTGYEFTRLKFSQIISPKGKSTEEFFAEIAKIANEFDKAVTSGYLPQSRLLEIEEVKLSLMLMDTWEGVDGGLYAKESVQIIEDFILSAKGIGMDVGQVSMIASQRILELELPNN